MIFQSAFPARAIRSHQISVVLLLALLLGTMTYLSESRSEFSNVLAIRAAESSPCAFWERHRVRENNHHEVLLGAVWQSSKEPDVHLFAALERFDRSALPSCHCTPFTETIVASSYL